MIIITHSLIEKKRVRDLTYCWFVFDYINKYLLIYSRLRLTSVYHSQQLQDAIYSIEIVQLHA